jgi:flagellar biosynthesis activator protein FlaF
MYYQLYEEVAEEASNKIRDNERRAFRHSINLLLVAQKSGARSKECVEALFFLSRLWGVLLEDLASPENALPDQLRAKLISIGIWLLRYAEEVRTGKQSDLQPMIDISDSIQAGLATKS